MTLPNFIIGGTPKSGTTSLFHYLKQHPEVFVSSNKEPRYFLLDASASNPNVDDRIVKLHRTIQIPVRSKEQYIALFDGVTNQKAIGEATPFYFYSSVALNRILNELPSVKMIFLLRNPVERAISDYWHAYRNEIEKRPVHEAMNINESYVQFGFYYSYLINWVNAFKPEQLMILTLDKLGSEPVTTFHEVCRFLEIDDSFIPDTTIRNMGGKPQNQSLVLLVQRIKKSRLTKAIYPKLPRGAYSTWSRVRERYVYSKEPSLPSGIVNRLNDFYHDDIVQLEQLLGQDLSNWK